MYLVDVDVINFMRNFVQKIICKYIYDAPNSAPGVKQGCHFFPVYYKLINFKLVHSYNVKHLTCTILCSSGLQNIYKLYIWKCSTFTIFTLFAKETKIHIHKTKWSSSGYLVMC